jgi:hypothetical protein
VRPYCDPGPSVKSTGSALELPFKLLKMTIGRRMVLPFGASQFSGTGAFSDARYGRSRNVRRARSTDRNVRRARSTDRNCERQCKRYKPTRHGDSVISGARLAKCYVKVAEDRCFREDYSRSCSNSSEQIVLRVRRGVFVVESASIAEFRRGKHGKIAHFSATVMPHSTVVCFFIAARLRRVAPARASGNAG